MSHRICCKEWPRRSWIARAAAVACFLVVSDVCYAQPWPDGESDDVILPLVSQYQDGAADAAGNVYTHYRQRQPDGSWGPQQENRLTIEQMRNGVDNGSIRLEGLSGGAWVPYAGAGADLNEHRTNFGWNAGYRITYRTFALLVDQEIDFVWNVAWTEEQRLAKRQEWEHGTEDWLNNRYNIVRTESDQGGNLVSEYTLPIFIDITFEGYDDGAGGRRFDHQVTVDPGSGRETMTHWFETTTVQDSTHETLHMLGAYDTYWGGALSPDLSTDYGSIMGAPSGTLNSGEGLRDIQYEPFMDWLKTKDPDANKPFVIYRLVQIPEPGAMLLLLLAAGWAVLIRRRKGEKLA